MIASKCVCLVALSLLLASCKTSSTVSRQRNVTLDDSFLLRCSFDSQASTVTYLAQWQRVGDLLILSPDTTAPATITETNVQASVLEDYNSKRRAADVFRQEKQSQCQPPPAIIDIRRFLVIGLYIIVIILAIVLTVRLGRQLFQI